MRQNYNVYLSVGHMIQDSGNFHSDVVRFIQVVTYNIILSWFTIYSFYHILSTIL